MRLKKLDSLLADFQKKHQKPAEWILINSEEAEKLRGDIVKLNNMESESTVDNYKGARIIRSNDIYPGEVKIF